MVVAVMSGCIGSGPDGGQAGADAPSDPLHDPGWPPVEAARVRPGVQVGWLMWSDEGEPVELLSGCTANFLFRSPDNASLFLGMAAHCLLETQEVGDPISIGKGEATGTLWYSSWLAMDEAGIDEPAMQDWNDFALVRIDDEHRPKVHPAILHYGGPLSMASPLEVAPGDGVFFYGNSDLRQSIEPTNWHEGCVVDTDGHILSARFWASGMPADSGSPVLDEDGRALGVLTQLIWDPQEEPQPENRISLLEPVLTWSIENAGIDVQLVTWPLLQAPLPPYPPLC